MCLNVLTVDDEDLLPPRKQPFARVLRYYIHNGIFHASMNGNDHGNIGVNCPYIMTITSNNFSPVRASVNSVANGNVWKVVNYTHTTASHVAHHVNNNAHHHVGHQSQHNTSSTNNGYHVTTLLNASSSVPHQLLADGAIAQPNQSLYNV
ncbi:hypothetical protein CHUAL_007146 [Chamberlinius hualienensis]